MSFLEESHVVAYLWFILIKKKFGNPFKVNIHFLRQPPSEE
jgi:hypothetical protein